MKIGVIGASGKVGSLIAYEAYKRGHEVTALVRDPLKMLGAPYKIMEKDLFALTPDDLRAFDAVVCAFGLPFGGDHPDNAYRQAVGHLIEVFEQLPEVRLLVVGGAASLYTDESKTKRVLETLPEAYRRDPADMMQALIALQKSDINYTYFSPARTFDPRGRKTRTYRLGDDVMIQNESGESYISYADYAWAMVDEIENGDHIRKRFTAVSDSRRPPANKPYHGIRAKAPVFEGMSQYREPFNFELAGRKLSLVFDDGSRFFVEFLDGHVLRWTALGAAGTVERYECAKGGEEAYFVNFELSQAAPRTNLTLVLDTRERLVTMVKTVTDYDQKYPFMVDSAYFFGTVDEPGFPLPTRRHRYTTDLLGKRIHWHYGPETEIIHVYYATDYIRVLTPEGHAWEGWSEEEWNELLEREPYDEPAAYVKIRPGLYLVGCTERNMSIHGRTGNSLLFLIDTVRVHDVGRSFGHTGLAEGKIRPENYLFGAFGDFVPSDGVAEAKPNPYKR